MANSAQWGRVGENKDKKSPSVNHIYSWVLFLYIAKMKFLGNPVLLIGKELALSSIFEHHLCRLNDGDISPGLYQAHR